MNRTKLEPVISRQRKYQLSRVSESRCEICGKRATKSLCKEHLAYSAGYYTGRNHAKDGFIPDERWFLGMIKRAKKKIRKAQNGVL